MSDNPETIHYRMSPSMLSNPGDSTIGRLIAAGYMAPGQSIVGGLTATIDGLRAEVRRLNALLSGAPAVTGISERAEGEDV